MNALTSKFGRYLALYLAGITLLFLYSFTQIDLGLTLTNHDSWRPIQTFFQNIGYFHRPLSTTLYLLVVGILFVGYLKFVGLAKHQRLDKKTIWKLIIGITILLTFAYNAFSHDLFNYIFDARIVTYYEQNPYEHKALDFPTDYMLGFMHWVHRTYPYGPIWLLLTVPLTFIGMENLLPTMILFKLLSSVSFLVVVWSIGRILRNIAPKYELLGVVFFALNPLVIIESLVSAHNDISMMAFSLFGLYLLTTRRYGLSIVFQLFAVGVKFATVFLLPLHIYVWFKRKHLIDWERLILGSLFLLIAAVLLVIQRTNFQPWYLLFVLPYAALLGFKKVVAFPVYIFTVAALLHYVPYLYTGNWDAPIPAILSSLLIVAVISSFASVIILSRTKKIEKGM